MQPNEVTVIKLIFDIHKFKDRMLNAFGRQPNHSLHSGFDGFYEFIYIPKDEDEKKSFPGITKVLAEELDKYNIIFSGSDCSYCYDHPCWGPHARVMITHPLIK